MIHKTTLGYKQVLNDSAWRHRSVRTTGTLDLCNQKMTHNDLELARGSGITSAANNLRSYLVEKPSGELNVVLNPIYEGQCQPCPGLEQGLSTLPQKVCLKVGDVK